MLIINKGNIIEPLSVIDHFLITLYKSWFTKYKENWKDFFFLQPKIQTIFTEFNT